MWAMIEKLRICMFGQRGFCCRTLVQIIKFTACHSIEQMDGRSDALKARLAIGSVEAYV
jgi:hypothetical protein